jgi:nitroreductase
MDIAEAVESRRSVRAFLDKPVAFQTVQRVLERARMAPSGCNYQPWEAVVMTGAPLKALQAALLAGAPDEPLEYDFSVPGNYPRYRSRFGRLGAAMYGAMGIGQGDEETRRLFRERNLVSFGAPVLLLCHFPKFMGPPQWSDVGMWLQTVMLLLRGEGLDSCPQEWMGVYGRTIKAQLGLSDDTLLFCGLAIGWRDHDAPVNSFTRDRVELADQASFLGFD